MREQDIFIEAMHRRDPADRQQYLDESCDGDPTLRERVEKLLRRSDHLGSFLEHPPVELAAVEPGAADISGENPDPTHVLGDRSSEVQQADTTSDQPDPTIAITLDAADIADHRRQEMDDGVPLGFLEPATRPDSLGRLAHYDVLEVLGRGAFGTVLKAFDTKLHRVVAIKVLAPELAATSPARKRFLREARASAAIRHDNVVSIHAVEDEPIPYLVMEYVPGETLQQRLDDHGPLDLPDALKIGKQIADGLAAAHAQQLIHRDIKPGNILLETSLDDHVKVTDFGLARTVDDASMSQSGVIAGTPMYMAPEQAQGQQLDQRADLFSLGSVLYQMLTGRPPFRAPSMVALLKRVTEDTPRPIQEIVPEVPNWMCAIVGHLHAKNPDERYGSAREVSELLAQCADDLQAGRVPKIPGPAKTADNVSGETCEPAQARRSESLLHSPLVKIAAVVVIMLGALGITEATGVTQIASTVIRLTTGSGTLVIETDDPGVKIAIDGEEVTITGGGVEELTLRPGEYKVAALKNGKPVKQELVTISKNNTTTLRISLERDDSGGETAKAPYVQIPEKTLDDRTPCYALEYSEDGRMLASGGSGEVRVWDAASGKLRFTIPIPNDWRCTALTFTPDSKYLLTAPQSGQSKAAITIWDTDSGQPAGELDGHNTGIYELSVSADGKTLISGGWNGYVRVWDFPERRMIRDIPSPTNHWIRSAQFSNQGKIAFGQDKVFLFEPDGTLLKTIEKYAAPLRFSRDGRLLAGTTWEAGTVTVWNVESGDEIASWKAHNGKAEGLAFSRDGRILATAGDDSLVRLWSPESGDLLAELPHGGKTNWVAFSPDGTTLVTAGHNAELKIWRLQKVLSRPARSTTNSTKPFQWPADAPLPAIAPFDAKQADAHQEAWAKHLGVPVEKEIILGQDADGQDVTLTMVLIPPGEFLMGTLDDERASRLAQARADGDQWALERIPSEGPQHRVRITRPFWLGRYEVTVAQFRQFVEQTHYKTEAERDGIGGFGLVAGQWVQDPKFVWNGDHEFPHADQDPVVFVSWNDATAYCQWLSQQPGEFEFSLPTEAQWEFACRSGTTTPWYGGASEAELPKYAWFDANSKGQLHSVGQRQANGFGLFDMHGNVWEWCADRYAPDFYAHSPVNDPAGPETGGTRVQRGGDWFYSAEPCRSANRHRGAPTDHSVSLGFRLAASPKE